MLRVVLDVNVLISALLLPGVPRSILESVGEDKFIMVLSSTLLEDFLRTIEKPKLKKLITPDLLEEIIALIHRKALIVEPKRKITACRDPDDNAVLEAAMAAKAIIVTGDKDILSMKNFKNLRILSPRAFWSKLRAPDFDRGSSQA